jgi:hypothetical protein
MPLFRPLANKCAGISNVSVGTWTNGRWGWKYRRYAPTYRWRSWVLGRVPIWSEVLVLVVLLLVIEDDWVARGEVGVVANEYLRVPNWDAWEADRAPRMAFLVESVIVETGKVP